MRTDDQELLVRALTFALEAHGHQKRKGKDVPYVSHLLQVAGHVLEYGGDPELAAAGLLHDTIEDCERVVTADIEARFGARIAGIVSGLTDLLDEEGTASKANWQERKERYLAHLREAPRDTRLVAGCDKLHNLTNITADLRTHGPQTLGRFNAGPERTLWYYVEVRRALGDDLPDGLLTELDLHLDALRGFLAGSRAE